MSVQRNISVSYYFNFFQMFLVVIPVLVVYQQTLGFSMSEILQLQAIFCAAVALFEVPTGYVADIWSRKASLCIGAFITALGFSGLPFIVSFQEFVIFQFILAFGLSLMSGADVAILYDSINEQTDRLKILGNASVYALVGEAVASIVCGLLVRYSFHAVLCAQVIVGWVTFFITLYFIEPEVAKMSKKNPFANMGMILKFLLVKDSFLRLIFINGVVWSLSTFCVVWLLQPFWQQASLPLSYFGFLWAFLMLVAAFFSKIVHFLERRYTVKTLLLFLSIAPCFAYILMYFGSLWFGIFAGILFYASRGISSVIMQDALNWRVPSSFRSTANSLKSLFFRLSYGFIGPVAGLSVDRYGLSLTLLFHGLIFLALFLLVMLPLIKRVAEMRIDYVPNDV